MKKSELQKLLREEIRKAIKEETFKVFGGIHSDEQLDAMENSLKIFKSKDPMVWEKYIETLVSKGYDKPSHKENPHYVWATKQLAKFK